MTLSTRVTWISKFVVPTLLAAFLSAGAIMTWLEALHAGESIGELLANTSGDAVALGLFLLLLLTSIHDAIRIKHVTRDASGIHVSNYRRTIHLPFTAIAAVHQHTWRPDGAISLHLYEPSPFGRRIFFVPPGLTTQKSRQIAGDLRERARTRA